jgi:16S rRNA processing protein RimM
MELIKIGKTLKTHGYKGHIRIFIDEFYMDDFEEMDAIFIDKLPYFIISKDINTDSSAIIALDDITSKESAALLQGKDIYAKEDDLSEILEDEPYFELKGYEMQDEQTGKIGNIRSILEMPGQVMAEVERENGTIVPVPLNDEFIKKTDDASKTVTVRLPDGFLDIF